MIRGQDIPFEAAALREAVNCGDFARAAQSGEFYCQAIRAMAPTARQPEAARVASEAQALLAWARRNLCAHRARVAYRLRDVQRLARYRQPVPRSHTWAIRG